MKGLARVRACGALLVGAVSCAGPATQIVSETRELSEASHAPSFRSVEDVGPADVLLTSPLNPQPSDGVAVVGELLWLHGSDFGRRPTVLVAAQSVPVLARTQDEGVVVRVPPGAPAGAQTVVLSNEHGEARAPLTIVRRIIVQSPTDGRIVTLTEGTDGPEGPAQPLNEPVAAFAASEEGRAIYALKQPPAGAAHVSVVALAAQGGGRAVSDVDLSSSQSSQISQIGSAWALDVTAREGHAALFVLGEKGLATFDLSSPLRPASRGVFSWPRPLGRRGLRRVAVSGDGRWVALADGADSGVTFFALGQAGDVTATPATLAGEENPLPDLRANAIADLVFARDGRRLFVLAGPTTDGARVGNPEPTRLFTLTLAADRRHWKLSGSLPLPDIKWPTTLREARVRHLQSGASIRRPSTTLPLFVAGQSAEGPDHALVMRIDGEQIKSVATFPGTVLGLADAPDARWLVATVVDRPKGSLSVGAGGGARLVGFVVDDRPGALRTVPLGGASSDASVPRPVGQEGEEAPRRGSVEVQP